LNITLTLNGEPQSWDIAANETLLDVLRRNGHRGTKRVCESGECGACAVIVNGLAIDSCIQLAAQSDGAQLVTVEGLEHDGVLHPVQEEFATNGAIQCGFCIPGMVVTAANYMEQNPTPGEEDIRHVFIGNLCRCTGYKKPVEAVMSAVQRMSDEG
jgi:aerobic-type carbon monoxide dehydrogenase small subunit (CoxS/CutS family)